MKIVRGNLTASQERVLRFAERVCGSISQSGYDAYPVGGFVRDILLGKTPYDIDISTNAPDPIILRLFPYAACVGTGKYHFYRFKKAGYLVEISRMREDLRCYGRQAEFRFVDKIEDDLKRRDFTINALALRLPTLEIVDLSGGIEDIDRRVIRTIGEPQLRFEEDYLRMLRAIRYAGKLNFKLEKNTRNALVDMADRISLLSADRKREECILLLRAPGRKRSVEMMFRLGLLKFVSPSLDELFQGDAKAYSMTLKTISKLSPRHSVLLHFSALLYQLFVRRGRQAVSDVIGKDFNFDRRRKADILGVLDCCYILAESEKTGDVLPAIVSGYIRPASILSGIIRRLSGKEPVHIDFDRTDFPDWICGDFIKKSATVSGQAVGKLIRLLKYAYYTGEVDTPDEAKKWLRQYLL
ncbi:MAG: hypothetical protein B6D65_00990 [candidate division Zixibacteria bacterium 4484_93]|nr:MAG: hypothetical protein B6D65_00990 [candidate division Zixibacteria bacterium 4484_93]